MTAGAEVSGETAVVKATATENSPSSPETNADSSKISELSANAESEIVINGDKGSDCDPKSVSMDSKTEYQMQDLVDMLKTLKLNPLAKEFFPSSYNRDQMGPNHFAGARRNHRMRGNNFNQSRRRPNNRLARVQREDTVRRTVYVSDIDQNITEENLAALFSGYGQVVDCRICGDPHSHLRFAFVEYSDQYSARAALSLSGTILGFSPLKVLPSKTAILPVNPTFLPRSEVEREMCSRTVYCTNIDKKVTQADVKDFFESRCGEVTRLRLLGDQVHSTRIAFVEFAVAESAIMALDCSGEALGSQHIRVSPSKTPVRPQVSHPDDH